MGKGRARKVFDWGEKIGKAVDIVLGSKGERDFREHLFDVLLGGGR